MKNEEWKFVVSQDNNYMVSNLGRVISRGRVVYHPNGNITIKERILKLYKHKSGYMVASMNQNGHNRKMRVHVLVATAFIPNPDNKPWVNHIDGDRTNNEVSNLEWVTPAENNTHSTFTKMTKKYVGVRYEPKGNSWTCAVMVNKKRVHIGTFKDEETAHKERVKYLKTHLIPNKYAN